MTPLDLVRILLEEEVLFTLKPALAASAQAVLDGWQQDANGEDCELGVGGICQDVADAMASVLSDSGIECSTVSAQVGEQHVYVIAKVDSGVYEVDISPYTYETGGGYCWKKIPNVHLDKDDIIIRLLSSDPLEFESFTDSY